METKLSECEYIFIRCDSCGDQVKIGKNKGGYFKTGYDPSWIHDFLVAHYDCDSSKIRLVYE